MIQSANAHTGQVAGRTPRGSATDCPPAPVGSVLVAGNRTSSTGSPVPWSTVTATSPIRRPASSLRRNAPANPTSNNSRSRRRVGSAGHPGSGNPASSCSRVCNSTGRLRLGTLRRVRRIPRSVNRTTSERVGEASPLAACTAAMAALLRSSVAGPNAHSPDGLRASAAAARYTATSSASAGSACRPSPAHHADHPIQSER